MVFRLLALPCICNKSRQKTCECSLADKWHCFNHSRVSACNISTGTYLYKQYLNEEAVDPDYSL